MGRRLQRWRSPEGFNSTLLLVCGRFAFIRPLKCTGHIADGILASQNISTKRVREELSLSNALLARVRGLQSRDIRQVKVVLVCILHYTDSFLNAFAGPDEISWGQARVVVALLETDPSLGQAAALDDAPHATPASEETQPIEQSMEIEVNRNASPPRTPALSALARNMAGEAHTRNSAATNLFVLRKSTEALATTQDPPSINNTAKRDYEGQGERGLKRTLSTADLDEELTLEERVARNRQRALDRKRQKLSDRGQL